MQGDLFAQRQPYTRKVNWVPLDQASILTKAQAARIQKLYPESELIRGYTTNVLLYKELIFD